MRKLFLYLVIFTLTNKISKAQQYDQGDLLTDLIDTSTVLGKKTLSINSRLGDIGISGYFQPQFQIASEKGAESFAGGNFEPESNNRFIIRRGRVKIEHTTRNADGNPSTHFVFQIDGNAKGVGIRDLWGRFYEHKFQLFHLSMGMMARPFGNEILYSSSRRESPERGRMSQIIMNSERDLGVNLTFNPRKENSKFKWLNLDLGIYNGQGLAGDAEYDSYKDIIGRISAKNIKLPVMDAYFSAGVSTLFGGILNLSEDFYTPHQNGNSWRMYSNPNFDYSYSKARRHYYGADLQLSIPNKKGLTQFRGEYIFGNQIGTASNSATPKELPISNGIPAALYERPFDGAYFYFLQHLGSWDHQVVFKYDWYNPNLRVSEKEIKEEDNFSAADIKFQTLGFGYIYYMSKNFKLVLYYDRVINEKAAVAGWNTDRSDDIFTCRLQFSF